MIRTDPTHQAHACPECGEVSDSPDDAEIHLLVVHPFAADTAVAVPCPPRPLSPLRTVQGPTPAYPLATVAAVTPGRRGRRAAAVVLLVVGLAVAGVSGYARASGKPVPPAPVEPVLAATEAGREKTPAEAPAPAPAPTEDRDHGPQLTTSVDDGYELQLPAGWVAASLRQATPGEVLAAHPDVSGMFSEVLFGELASGAGSLLAMPPEGARQFLGITVSAAGEASLDEISETLPSDLAAQGATEMTMDMGRVANGPALRLAYTAPGPEGSVRHVRFVVVAPGRTYSLTFGTVSGARDLGLFNSVAATFRPH